MSSDALIRVEGMLTIDGVAGCRRDTTLIIETGDGPFCWEARAPEILHWTPGESLAIWNPQSETHEPVARHGDRIRVTGPGRLGEYRHPGCDRGFIGLVRGFDVAVGR